MALTSWEGQPQSWAHQRVEEVRASWDPNRLGQLRGVIQSSYFLPSAEGFAIAYGAGTMPELVEFTEDGAVLSAGNIIADQEHTRSRSRPCQPR